ncbi:MAG TPA: serine hydrolase domain-containing protein [Longimicrobiales bacterium]|nr:serine hydrolase domain-containing protein [Longimicrobiales bacterium]
MKSPAGFAAACFAYALPALLLLCGDAVAQTPDGAPPHPLEGRVDSIFAERAGTNSPGCAVAVMRGGDVVLKKAYGMANLSLGVPMTPATSVWIPYSETREFVALAVAMLARDGRISLDDQVRRHVPEVPSYAGDVRVRQLIHHTSGLADYGVLAGPGWFIVDRMSEDEFFRILTRWGKLGFEPGSAVMYSNTDYALLKILVERVTGGSLHAYLDEKLFRPLDMKSTRMGADQADVFPDHTLFHEEEDSGYRVVLGRVSPVGGISVTTSVDDVVRWEQGLRDRSLGLGALFAELRQGAPEPEQGFAFGIYGDVRNGVELEVRRGVGGYNYLVRAPEADIAVATICASYSRMWEYGPSVAMLFAAPDNRPVAAVAAPAAIPATTAAASAPTVPLSPTALQRYAGDYRSAGISSPSLRLAAADSGLQITTANGVKYDARPIGNHTFEVVLSPSLTARLVFAGEDAGMTLTVKYVETGETDPVLERWAPVLPSAAALRSYPGVYIGDDVEVTLHISVSGDSVMIAGRGLPATALRPTEQHNRFEVEDYEVAFHHDEAGNVTHLTLDAGRVKGMRFTRSMRQ